MSNTAITPSFSPGSRPRAWCITTLSLSPLNNDTNYTPNSQAELDALNFVDGYNLRLEWSPSLRRAPLTYAQGVPGIRFSFINPLESTDYRVFIQPMIDPVSYLQHTDADYGGNLNKRVPYRLCHVMNSVSYPKTRYGFWIQVGMPDADGNYFGAETVYSRQRTSSLSQKTIALSVVVL